MHYNVNTVASTGIVNQARTQTGVMERPEGKAEGAKSAANSALTHSPKSRASAAKYLDEILCAFITGAHGFSDLTINCTQRAINSYVTGDATMSADAARAAGEIPKLDMPGE